MMNLTIKNELTNEFLSLFIENLKPIFVYEIDQDFMLYNTGTIGWSKAFHKTCDDLNKDTLKAFYDSLSWEDFDEFCVEVGQLIVDKNIVQ